MSSKPLRQRVFRLVLFPALLFLAFAVLAAVFFFTIAGPYLVHADEPTKAQVAVVLAGDTTGQRILRGAELKRMGLVDTVLVSGGPWIYGTFESDLAVRFAVAKGFPENYFEPLHDEVKSTQAEAHSILLHLKRRGIQSALIVTSDYHTRRSGLIWHYMAPWLNLRLVAAKDLVFRPEDWWRDREASKHVYSEWTKLLAFTFDFFPPEQSQPVLFR
jgi:uncharacterized SAM-binding protein YcdF (DUF218 family)